MPVEINLQQSLVYKMTGHDANVGHWTEDWTEEWPTCHSWEIVVRQNSTGDGRCFLPLKTHALPGQDCPLSSPGCGLTMAEMFTCNCSKTELKYCSCWSKELDGRLTAPMGSFIPSSPQDRPPYQLGWLACYGQAVYLHPWKSKKEKDVPLSSHPTGTVSSLKPPHSHFLYRQQR